MQGKILAVSLVFCVACVGDSSNPPPSDGGPDATTDVNADVAPNDAATDTPAAACDLAKPFGTPVALSSTINNVQWVGWAALTHDELTMTYSVFNGTPPIHLYASSRATTSDAFTTGAALAMSGANNDDTPSVTGDNLTLYFSSDRSGGSSYHLWAASRAVTSTDFGSPLPVTSLASGAGEYQPSVSADGTVLYFASSRTGGAGADDLYRATRPTNGSFSLDTPGPFTVVNTSSSEDDPVFSPDELTLYFSSDRTGGKGGADVWKATRATTSAPFGNATNVTELNGPNSDVPTWISDDGCRIYMTRGGLGNYAIYSATKSK